MSLNRLAGIVAIAAGDAGAENRGMSVMLEAEPKPSTLEIAAASGNTGQIRPTMRISPRTALALVAAAIAGATAAYFVPKPLPELSRAEFIDEVRAGHVRSVVIEDQELITGVQLDAWAVSHRLPQGRGWPATDRIEHPRRRDPI
jgi:hypothetical protein